MWLLTTLGNLARLVILCIGSVVRCRVRVALLADSRLMLWVRSVWVKLISFVPLDIETSVWCRGTWLATVVLAGTARCYSVVEWSKA